MGWPTRLNQVRWGIKLAGATRKEQRIRVTIEQEEQWSDETATPL